MSNTQYQYNHYRDIGWQRVIVLYM